MCKFKYNIGDTVYLKGWNFDIPLGSRVTVVGRVDKDGTNYYKITKGELQIQKSDKPTANGVSEEYLSDRPPFETLYAIKVELFNPNKYKDHFEDIQRIEYVVGNLDLAVETYNTKVEECEEITLDKKLYGKCVLYIPTIYNSGRISEFAEEEKIINQRFFFTRG